MTRNIFIWIIFPISRHDNKNIKAATHHYYSVSENDVRSKKTIRVLTNYLYLNRNIFQQNNICDHNRIDL